MLDSIGLTKKDSNGMRLRTDGKGPLSMDITTLGGQFIQYTQISQMVSDQWKKIGIQLIVQEVERSLAITRAAGNQTQLLAWGNDGTDTLFMSPGWLFPIDGTSWYSPLYGKWFASNGTQGKEPPAQMKEVMAMWKKAAGVPDAQQIQLGKAIWKIVLDQLWHIGVVGQSGAVQGILVAKTNMGNVPSRFANVNLTWPPSVTRPVTFYWKT